MDYIAFARLFGVVSTVLALGVLFNLDDARRMAKDMIGTASGYLLAGVLPLIFGTWVVTSTGSWDLNWSLVVTLIGWVMLLFGCFRLLFVGLWLSWARQATDEAPLLFSFFGLMMGLLLLYIGFLA